MGTHGTRVGMPEKHPGWSRLIWALTQDPSLSLLDQWLPMCGTGNLCCIPSIPANTHDSMENKAQVQGKQNPSWNKQSRRWGRMQTEVWDWNKEFEKWQPDEFGRRWMRGGGAKMRWRTYVCGVETSFCPHPVGQLDVQSCFVKRNTFKMQSGEQGTPLQPCPI